MTIVLACPVIGAGTEADPTRPSIASDIGSFAVLSIEDPARNKTATAANWTAICVLEDPTAIALVAGHPEAVVLIDDTRARFKTQIVPNGRLNSINSFMTARGYTAAGTGLTWQGLIEHFARQVPGTVGLLDVI